METHKVFNQAPQLVDYNMFTSDRVLVELMNRYDAQWAIERLTSFGQYAGSAQAHKWAVRSNTIEPKLDRFDARGNRINFVEYDESYHNLMRTAIANGLHSLPWTESRPGAHAARAGLFYMDFQNEAGHACPMSMTYSVVPVLRKHASLGNIWLPRLLSTTYDERFLPASQKNGITMGMGMTEKQGGTDLRNITTTATVSSFDGTDYQYILTGHKWFTSAPMSDAFLMLAKTGEKEVSCFLVPRFRPDGTLNGIELQRLKDKLGNRSNASSEPELVDCMGWLIGEKGRGIPTIIEMVNHTRLDCAISSAALMRRATMEALHHTHHRKAFGKLLSDQPLMQNVLADLALESEAAISLVARLAHAYDGTSSADALFKRLVSAVSKFWICERAPTHVFVAMQQLGGNGYVEESPLPRLYRESPLLSIWEGCGNVICLDVLRAIKDKPETLDVLFQELDLTAGHSKRIDRHVAAIKSEGNTMRKRLSSKSESVRSRCDANARRLTENLAVALQANLLVRHAPPSVADAFVASRLGNQSGLSFGTLPAGTKFGAILERAYSLA